MEFENFIVVVLFYEGVVFLKNNGLRFFKCTFVFTAKYRIIGCLTEATIFELLGNKDNMFIRMGEMFSHHQTKRVPSLTVTPVLIN